jgi:eukaryotic-like serine/threonine-protein kinase
METDAFFSEEFVLLEKLGEGGMATIFLARRREDDTLVVVKRLHPHLADDSTAQERFKREVQVACILNHPNIGRLYHSRKTEDLWYIAMEFIPGQDLEFMNFNLWREGRMLPPELSVRVGLDVLEALEYAHHFKGADGTPLQIVHRDLSPKNVMMGFDGHSKVIDFGLTRTILGEFRTRTGMVVGTLRYMSPEQAVAEPVDARSDLYSWSVVLYEMLSGRPLVTGTDPPSILKAVVTEDAPPLSERNPKLPPAFDAVLAKGLSKDREDRWSSASEFASALAEAAGSLASTPRELIAGFVRSHFPESYATAQRRLSEASGETSVSEPTELRTQLYHSEDRALARQEWLSYHDGKKVPALEMASVYDRPRRSDYGQAFYGETVVKPILPSSVSASPEARSQDLPWAPAVLWSVAAVALVLAVAAYVLLTQSRQAGDPGVRRPLIEREVLVKSVTKASPSEGEGASEALGKEVPPKVVGQNRTVSAPKKTARSSMAPSGNIGPPRSPNQAEIERLRRELAAARFSSEGTTGRNVLFQILERTRKLAASVSGGPKEQINQCLQDQELKSDWEGVGRCLTLVARELN